MYSILSHTEQECTRSLGTRSHPVHGHRSRVVAACELQIYLADSLEAAPFGAG